MAPGLGGPKGIGQTLCMAVPGDRRGGLHRSAVGDVPVLKSGVGGPQWVAKTVERFGVDAVIHFAAYKSPGESMPPHRYFANDVARSAKLLATLPGAGVGRSSSLRPVPSTGRPSGSRWGRTSRPATESPYGESRDMTERAPGWNDLCRDLRPVSLRYSDAPGAWPDGSIREDWTVTIKLVPLMKAALGPRGPLEVFGGRLPDTGPGRRSATRPRRRPGRGAREGAAVSRGRGETTVLKAAACGLLSATVGTGSPTRWWPWSRTASATRFPVPQVIFTRPATGASGTFAPSTCDRRTRGS
jgi:hypothetical protein